MKAVVTILIVLLSLHLCFAQNNAPLVHFNLLSIKDGMPEGTVRDLLQDKDGYIWIATQKGLVHYDGYTTKVYDFGIKNPYGIIINKLLEDSRGGLWAALDSGLYKYDRASDRFVSYIKKPTTNIAEGEAGNLWLITSNFSGRNQSLIFLNPVTKKEVLFGMEVKGKHHVNALYYPEVFKDKQQRIWVGSNNGLYEYNTKDSTFIPHFASEDSSKQITIVHVKEDAEQPGIFYFSTWGTYPYKGEGLGSYNSNTGSFTIFHHNAKDANSIGSDTIWQVQNDSKGRVWILTAAGLSLFSPATQTFTNYTAYPTDAFKYYPANEYAIKEGKQGNLWCNSNAGLFYFNVITRQFTQYTADTKSQNGLADYNLHHLMMDRSGILWFGASQAGLQWVDSKHHRFIKYANNNAAEHLFKGGRPTSFAEAKDGSIWLSAEHGLYHWIPQQDSFELIKFAPSANENTGVYHVFYDSKGLIWFTAYNPGDVGLYCYNPSTGKAINYRYHQNDTTSLSNDNISSIYEDHSGDVWIGTSGSGICRFNRHSQTFTRFPFIFNDASISDTHGALDDDEVGCTYVDKEGTLWVGTNNGGLNRFNRKDGTFTSYVGRLAGFNCSKGRLWAGTFFGGLFELNKNRDSIKRITEKDGLLYDGAMATAEDNTGNIWVTSQRGISILNPATGQVRTLTDDNNFNGYNYTIIKTNAGDLLMSTIDGFIALNPNDYAPDTEAPMVHIEDMHLTELVNNKPKDSAIMVASQTSYQFHYDENRISFRYVGLYYPDAQATQYAYKLDGYDKDWIPAGTQRIGVYTNLSPGTYTFHVKAANSDGVWSKDDSITFTITPPWWKTRWVYLLYTVALVAAVWLLIAYRSMQLKKANKVLEEKVVHRTEQLKQSLEDLKSTQSQLIQSEKMASLGELTAGIAHEIQNPLNFVNNFSEVNQELLAELKDEADKGNIEEVKAIANDVIDNEEKINHHGKRADAIVKGMLQHSRASSGQKELTDINKLADEYLRLSYHGMRAKDKTFDATLQTDFDSSIGKINVVPQDIGRVLLNLFNNAFYAVSEKQKAQGLKQEEYKPIVSVQTKKINDKVEISVRDNGNGIPQNIVDKIFQPFFTTKPTGQGTGLGLSLAYDIIKAHGGNIKVETKEVEGSEFIILLPV